MPKVKITYRLDDGTIMSYRESKFIYNIETRKRVCKMCFESNKILSDRHCCHKCENIKWKQRQIRKMYERNLKQTTSIHRQEVFKVQSPISGNSIGY